MNNAKDGNMQANYVTAIRFHDNQDRKIGFLKREWTIKHTFSDIISMFKETNTHIKHQKQTRFFYFASPV